MGWIFDQVGGFIGVVDHVEKLAGKAVVVNILVAFISDHTVGNCRGFDANQAAVKFTER
jgi:hypothetical protein